MKKNESESPSPFSNTRSVTLSQEQLFALKDYLNYMRQHCSAVENILKQAENDEERRQGIHELIDRLRKGPALPDAKVVEFDTMEDFMSFLHKRNA